MDDAPLTAEELSSELIGLGKDDNKLKKTQLFIGIGIAALLVILIIIIIIVAASGGGDGKEEASTLPVYGIIKCIYDVSSSSDTKLLGDDFTKSFDLELWVDGNVQKFAKTYKFNSTGYHDIQFKIHSSSGVNLDYMFKGVEDLISIELTAEQNCEITSMVSTFENCLGLNHFNLTGFDGSKITSMQKLFFGSEIMNFYFNSFNTTNLQDISYMFSSTAISELTLKGINTNKVTNMSHLFDNCPSTESADFSSIDTSSVVDMSYMFQGNSAIKDLYLRNFKTGQVTSMKGMFKDCISLTNLDITSFDTNKVEDMF